MGKLRFKKHCEFCGTEFTAQKSSTRFCSHMCASRAYKARKRQLVEDQVNEKFSMEDVVSEHQTDIILSYEFLAE